MKPRPVHLSPVAGRDFAEGMAFWNEGLGPARALWSGNPLATTSDWPGPADQPHGLGAAAMRATVLDEIVTFAVRIRPFEHHRLLAGDARHQVQQRAAVIVH